MPLTRPNSDLAWMKRALRLAAGMRGRVWPNPPVGCVIVKNGVAVAGAATHPGGRPHAERQALDQAGAAADGAALYVTLEPCCHWGKTPPCADAIIEAGVARVVCAMQDPDPRVNGGGFARLRDAGVDVVVGLCAEEAGRIMSGFLHHVRTGQPELIVLDRARAAIPAGVDALIVSDHEEPRLLLRQRETFTSIDIVGVPKDRLLAHLAGKGLTSVAVFRGDPIARRVLAPGARHSPVTHRCVGIQLAPAET